MTTPTGSEAVIVDSSGWLEYLTEDLKADLFTPYIERKELNLVPTIVLYEVCKKLLMSQAKPAAERFSLQALRLQVIPLDEQIALAAARTGLDHRLAMADAIIYTTARHFQADLITSDAHFAGLPGVTLL